MTRAEKVIAFIERYCKVPEGTLVGQPVKLEPFQKKFLYDVYDNPHITRDAILSIGRKNGKTCFLACITLSHIVGPEALLNSQIASGAMSKENAALLFKAMHKMILLNDDLGKLVRVVPSQKQIFGLPMNTEYQALSKDGKTNMGGSPAVLILDETGQVIGANDDFVDAVITSQAAHENPIKFVISTQAANDSDLLSIWIDNALGGNDPTKVCHLYTTDQEKDLLDKEGWKQSNPAIGVFRSLKDMEKMAKDAVSMPSFENKFRNLYLNQRVAATSPFITKNTWMQCANETVPIEQCTEIYGGLDLSARTDLTSLVLYGLYGEKWNAYVYAWTPEVGLHERAKRDRAPYDVWVKNGVLRTTPSANIEYSFIAQELAEICSPLNITAIAYDRWRMDVLEKELERIGLELPLEPWGQGFKDMSPSLEAIEGVILNKKFNHGDNPVLNMCANNSMVTRDPAGNRKLDKMKTSGRIDCMVALCMAAGIAERKHEEGGSMDDYFASPLVL